MHIMTISLSRRFEFIIRISFLIAAFSNQVFFYGQEKFDPKLPFLTCNNFEIKSYEADKIASDNVVAFIPYQNGDLAALNLKTGENLWSVELGGKIISKPVLSKNGNRDLYIATEVLQESKYNAAPGKTDKDTNNFVLPVTYLRSLNSSTGLTNWIARIEERQLTEKEIFLYEFQDRVLVVKKNGYAAAYTKISGQILWKLSLETNLSAKPFFSEDKVILPLENKILGIFTQSGAVYFQYDIFAASSSVFLTKDDILIWGNASGNIFALETKTKKQVWKFRNGAEVSFINQVPDGLLITSFDNFVYFLSAKKGKLLWKKRFSGRITIEPLTTNNIAFVSSISDSEVSLLNLSDGKTLNLINLEAEYYQTSTPVIAENFLIIFTAKGLWSFSNNGC